MKYTQISLKLPEEVLDKVDSVAKNSYKKRSEIIREAVVAYVAAGRGNKGKKSGDDLLKDWMARSVDMGPTDAVKEHDTVF
jgi:predicted transcriptional regulator